MAFEWEKDLLKYNTKNKDVGEFNSYAQPPRAARKVQENKGVLPKQAIDNSTKQEENKPAYPKWELDSSKPYAGIVDNTWGKPKYDQAEAERQRRIIKTQGLSDVLRLVAEGITGAMGGDIIKRGKNQEIEKARGRLDGLREQYRQDKMRYNTAKMQELIRNINYGVTQNQKAKELAYQREVDEFNYNRAKAEEERRWNRNNEYADAVYDKQRKDNLKDATTAFERSKELTGYRAALSNSYRDSSDAMYVKDPYGGGKTKVSSEGYNKISNYALSLLSEQERAVLDNPMRNEMSYNEASAKFKSLMWKIATGQQEITTGVKKEKEEGTGDGVPEIHTPDQDTENNSTPKPQYSNALTLTKEEKGEIEGNENAGIVDEYKETVATPEQLSEAQTALDEYLKEYPYTTTISKRIFVRDFLRQKYGITDFSRKSQDTGATHKSTFSRKFNEQYDILFGK